MLVKNGRRKEKMRKKLKFKEKGITLVALVVSIVVLLILVGISISLVIGDNGLVQKSKDASLKTSKVSKEEKEDLENLAEYINNVLDIEDKVTDNTPGELYGEGTEDNPYLIESVEDIVKLSIDVNNGISYDGKIIELKQTINFNSDISYSNPETTEFGDINNDGLVEGLKQELTKGNGFQPIGKVENIERGSDDFGNKTMLVGKSFKGTFKGKNRAIKGLRIDSKEDYPNGIGIGLFGWNSGVIENLIVSGSITNEGNGYVGGISGFSNGTVINCVNKVKIDTKTSAGGIVGAELGKLTINSCTNFETICGKDTVGGILGIVLNDTMTEEKYSAMIGCYNRGNISGLVTGGILGSSNDATIYINECYNMGKVSSIDTMEKEIANIGGIAGKITIASYEELQGNIIKCHNIGEIYNTNCNGNSGGILANNHVWGNNSSNIEDCINSGNIYSKALATGGIVGYIQQQNGETKVHKCYNEGNIKGNSQYVGGISGNTINQDCGSIFISNVYNSGEIRCDSADSIGGIVGFVTMYYQYYIKNPGITNIKECYNVGNLSNETSETAYIGGIVGKTSTKLQKIWIADSINSGKIRQEKEYKGGILGKEITATTGNVESCYYNDKDLGGISGNDVSGAAEYLSELPSIIDVIGEGFKASENGYPKLNWQ